MVISDIFSPGTPARKSQMSLNAKDMGESARGLASRERIRGVPHRCNEEGGARTAIEGAET